MHIYVKKRWLAAVAAIATVATGAMIARAAWSANTAGQGESVAMIAQAITLAPSGTGTPTLYPGGPAATIYFTASNPNPYAVNFTAAAYSSPMSTSTASCASANIAIATSPPPPSTVSISLPANATNVQLSIPGVLVLSHSAPDGCQAVGFAVSVSLTGSEA